MNGTPRRRSEARRGGKLLLERQDLGSEGIDGGDGCKAEVLQRGERELGV